MPDKKLRTYLFNKILDRMVKSKKYHYYDKKKSLAIHRPLYRHLMSIAWEYWGIAFFAAKNPFTCLKKKATGLFVQVTHRVTRNFEGINTHILSL